MHKRTVYSITCYYTGATLVRVIAQSATQCQCSRSIQHKDLNSVHIYTQDRTGLLRFLVSTEAWLKFTWGVTLVVRLKCKSLFISNSLNKCWHFCTIVPCMICTISWKRIILICNHNFNWTYARNNCNKINSKLNWVFESKSNTVFISHQNLITIHYSSKVQGQ